MKSTAQMGARILGVGFLMIGLLGFFVPGGTSMEADPAAAGRILGLFPVNLTNTLVHLAFGAWGIVAARSFAGSRVFGRVGAGVYGALVLIAFVDPTLFGLAPIGSHDIWLHALLAVALAYVGFAAKGPAVGGAPA